MKHAHLGNPFRVGPHYRQGEAATAYLAYLRDRCRRDTPERRTILELAARVRGGEALRLMCWCKRDDQDVPCHADHIRAAVLGYAARDAVARHP